jgi:hypothetical protein
MSSGFHNRAVIHDHDEVGGAHRAEAVGDDEGGAVFENVVETLLDGAFAFGVERAGGFVEDEDARFLEQSAGDGDALLLPAGQRLSALADFGFVA